ncbi:MAG: hypothetical protein C0404_01675 [Verrucomicrobia bacterium]|nr:hypothetical protein [Verrucomicrobiota bacterium]
MLLVALIEVPVSLLILGVSLLLMLSIAASDVGFFHMAVPLVGLGIMGDAVRRLIESRRLWSFE